jgi:predicted SAM-dependent methyltransferase
MPQEPVALEVFNERRFYHQERTHKASSMKHKRLMPHGYLRLRRPPEEYMRSKSFRSDWLSSDTLRSYPVCPFCIDMERYEP